MQPRLYFILCFVVCTFSSQAQVRLTIFYDSVWAINSKKEATYFRNALFDTTSYAFLGPVMDYYSDGQLEMKGQYPGGRKADTFTFYYQNGQKKMEGKFSADQMTGIWEYFYTDGSSYQTIEFTENDFKVLSYYDQNRTQKVKEGRGLWEGTVYIPENEDSLWISGSVIDGYKDGWWTYYNKRGVTAYQEKYRKGRFLYGKKFSIFGKYTENSEKPVGKMILFPSKLQFTERFMYAPNVRQSDYPYLRFLPDEKTVYLDKNRMLCDQQNAKYYRQTNEINVERPTGALTDYHMNGKVYRSGRYITGKKHGAFVYYHENGNIESKGTYDYDVKKGEWKDYYSDGSLRQIIIYEEGKPQVYSYWDEEGVLQTFRGTGSYETLQHYHTVTLIEKGKLTDYQKTGKWQGFTLDGALFYEERYKDGELVEGYSFDTAGHQINYEQRIVQAEPADGIHEFYQFVNKKIKYPSVARNNSIQGKVLVQVVVDAEGNLLRSEALSSPHEILSKEALRVVGLYHKWKAGKEMGQAIEMTFILPISFAISDYDITLFN